MGPLRVDETATGADVIERVRNAHDDPFAIVLQAARLADDDGFEVAASLVRRGDETPAIVMLLTTDDERPNVSRCRTAGVGAVTKPLTHRDLLRALCQALEIGEHDPSSVGDAAAGTAGGPRRISHVLVAEDNPLNQELIRTLLARRGHTSVMARTGRDAIERLAREEFDIVLMDVQMPELDGIEATLEIRAAESPDHHIPIVALTASTTNKERERSLAAGMDAHISKPIDSPVLFNTLAGC